MSKEKNAKIDTWGGKREGAGRKGRNGGTEKICVSVNRQNWQSALSKWNQKPSWLVDLLITRYLETEGALQ